MLAPWQRPELFLGEVIRHNLAPAEDRNTELASIRFAQAACHGGFASDQVFGAGQTGRPEAVRDARAEKGEYRGVAEQILP